MEDRSEAPAPQAVESDREDDEVALDSVALARLLEEVRNDAPVSSTVYNRTYNRHNR